MELHYTKLFFLRDIADLVFQVFQGNKETNSIVHESEATKHEGTTKLVPKRADPVYTVPDPHGHDIKLNSFKTSVALNSITMLYDNITEFNNN